MGGGACLVDDIWVLIEIKPGECVTFFFAGLSPLAFNLPVAISFSNLHWKVCVCYCYIIIPSQNCFLPDTMETL